MIAYATINDRCKESFCAFVGFKSKSGKKSFQCSFCKKVKTPGEPEEKEVDEFTTLVEKAVDNEERMEINFG